MLKILQALEKKDYDSIEEISLIGNFLLRNYFYEVIDNDKSRELIYSFQAILFENFVTFLRIKKAVATSAPLLREHLKVRTEQLEQSVTAMKFDRFSYSQFFLNFFHSGCLQSLDIFKAATEKKEDIVKSSRNNVRERDCEWGRVI